ncbi:hypothetical protein HFP15_02135 [Amycolatopsis sp. K13G38]|uniref:Mce-associated membrane protein n=1 Tax=Amycolatopsis acididurans TaxID=2724524 RepID=A0ABX1IW18_9PSEU|nr:hypothetical protein [Amycolatopsis acididurans]NKQ51677.1 hypothetical protein [Amycolatopsis acididurans]
MTEKTMTVPSPVRRPSPVPRDPAPSPVPRDVTPSPVQPESKRRSLLRRIPLTAVIAAVLVLAAGAAALVLQGRASQADRVEAARSAALQAARQHVPEVLSYNADTVDKDLAAAVSATTGQFRAELSDLQRTVIRPSATADKISTRTTVSDAGVVRAAEHEVVVLLFINQLTSSQKQTTPRVDGARVRVTMQDVNGDWLVSALQPV